MTYIKPPALSTIRTGFSSFLSNSHQLIYSIGNLPLELSGHASGRTGFGSATDKSASLLKQPSSDLQTGSRHARQLQSTLPSRSRSSTLASQKPTLPSSAQSSFQAQYSSVPTHLRPQVIAAIHEAVGKSHDAYTAWLESNVDQFSIQDRNELVGFINRHHGDAFHKLEDHKLAGYEGEVGDWESDLERLKEIMGALGVGPDRASESVSGSG